MQFCDSSSTTNRCCKVVTKIRLHQSTNICKKWLTILSESDQCRNRYIEDQENFDLSCTVHSLNRLRRWNNWSREEIQYTGPTNNPNNRAEGGFNVGFDNTGRTLLRPRKFLWTWSERLYFPYRPMIAKHGCCAFGTSERWSRLKLIFKVAWEHKMSMLLQKLRLHWSIQTMRISKGDISKYSLSSVSYLHILMLPSWRTTRNTGPKCKVECRTIGAPVCLLNSSLGAKADLSLFRPCIWQPTGGRRNPKHLWSWIIVL